MRIRACALTLFLLSCSSIAQEKERWERVYTLEDATIAMNSTRVELTEGALGRVQFRWNFSKPQPVGDASDTKYKTRVETVEFNCSRRRYRLTAYTLLDSRGKSISSKELEPEELEWKFVKPGGMMERLLGPACRLIEEKRQSHRLPSTAKLIL
ncbi:MAG TPA: surface-adhesin E family protein [Pyrinomonadaceae bacterium]|nr:surface-adhesin E family protein [Pyrinomonadaceae bacterium]